MVRGALRRAWDCPGAAIAADKGHHQPARDAQDRHADAEEGQDVGADDHGSQQQDEAIDGHLARHGGTRLRRDVSGETVEDGRAAERIDHGKQGGEDRQKTR